MVQGKMTVSDEHFIEVMEALEMKAYTTGEIAGEVDMGPDGVRNRLKKLVEDGRVRMKKADPKTTLWALAEDYPEPEDSGRACSAK